jgi:hypothetical protein
MVIEAREALQKSSFVVLVAKMRIGSYLNAWLTTKTTKTTKLKSSVPQVP